MKTCLPGLLACGLLGGLVMTFVEGQPPENITIKGFVFDADGKAVADADILIVSSNASGRPITTKSGPDGAYQKEIKAGGKFDVSYQHTDAGKAVVTKLSGTKDQNISIVLYTRAQVAKMSPSAVFGELEAYEYTIMLAHGSSDFAPAMKASLTARETMDRLELLGMRIGSAKTGEFMFLRTKIEFVKSAMRF